jgi:hypothetical protein
MDPELARKAAEKVRNPHILVNLVSRRVRQFNTGGGPNRPLIAETAGKGAGDIALIELLEDKMGWELFEDNPLLESTGKSKKKKR